MVLQLRKALIPPHPLASIEIENYYKNEPRFKDVYSRDNLLNKIKNGAYIVNLDVYQNIGTHWIALYVTNNTRFTYFDSFGVGHIPTKIKVFTGNKDIKTNIYRIQDYSSMCG